MCIINHILSHMHGCANWCHETSLTLSIVNWLNAVCHCQCCSHTLTFISTPLTHISLNRVCPSITNYLTSSIHFSPILKENRYHLFPLFLCWCVQRSGAILRSPTWSANANAEKVMVGKQMLDNIYLLLFFTFTKMQTQHWLCQSITHLPGCSRKHVLSIDRTHSSTNVPKDANRMACLEKAMLWMTFFAFKWNSSAVHTQTQQLSFLFNPQNSSKNMHTSAPFLVQAISVRKCFNHKEFLRGDHILTWPQEKHAKLCASLITVYPICMDVQTDAMKPHQPHPWNIGSMQSAIANVVATLWPSFLPPSNMHFFESRLSIHHKLPYWQHSLQPHSEGEYQPTLYAHCMLLRTKEWHHSEESPMVSKCKHTKKDDQPTNARQYIFIALL